MGTKQLETLPEDIYSLFDPSVDHECNEENLNAFAENIKELLRQRLKAYTPPTNPLRFSALGRADRQVWYDAHPDPGLTEPMLPKVYVKFLYGDIIEQMLLFLAKEAGHEVTHHQAEVEVDGVKGHIDAIIDGTVVDVKSASSFGYKKFQEGTVTQDDPFGYVYQLSGYASVLTPGKPAAWLANDKVHGDICVAPLSKIVIDHHPPAERIKHLKKVVEDENPPERCYEPVPDGASGNLKLPIGCSYCKHKFRCYPNLRTFLYSDAPRYLTKVVKTPKVPEITETSIDE